MSWHLCIGLRCLHVLSQHPNNQSPPDGSYFLSDFLLLLFLLIDSFNPQTNTFVITVAKVLPHHNDFTAHGPPLALNLRTKQIQDTPLHLQVTRVFLVDASQLRKLPHWYCAADVDTFKKLVNIYLFRISFELMILFSLLWVYYSAS